MNHLSTFKYLIVGKSAWRALATEVFWNCTRKGNIKNFDKTIVAFTLEKTKLYQEIAVAVSGAAIALLALFGPIGLTTLSRAITTSAKSIISSASGMRQNFTDPVAHVVAEADSARRDTVMATVSKPFTMVWGTTTANESITLPLVSAGTYDFTVDWGDGANNVISAWDDANKTHSYAKTGDHTVTIVGTLRGWSFGGGARFWDVASPDYANPNAEKLKEISAWGGMAFGNTDLQFAKAANLKITAADSPDLSETKSLRGCFLYATFFNSDISAWDTANITDMYGIFYEAAAFNQPIGNWNTANVIFMCKTFAFASAFNQPIGNWNTRNVTDMNFMFAFTDAFNQPIGNWNIAKVDDMSYMFYEAAAFNQPIERWNISAVKYMVYMFYKASAFNQPIGNWNTHNVTDMSFMFYEASAFNQPIGRWNTHKVNNMSYMFYGAKVFNQPIENWNTHNVNNMSYMFYGARVFNQPIGNWNTAKVDDMSYMFYDTRIFNQPIENWNTAKVTDMSYMFYGASVFNQPIGNWNTAKVDDMSYMFYEANSFNQDLSLWSIENVTVCADFSSGANAWVVAKPPLTECVLVKSDVSDASEKSRTF